MKVKSWLLILISIIAGLALFPILQFEYFKRTPAFDKASSFWLWFRILFSGPLLVIIGVSLLFLLKGKHRIFGGICLCIGLYWIIGLIRDMV